jgi:hypothetical protein
MRPKARLAGRDHPAECRWRRVCRDHAPDRQSKTCVWRWQERFATEGVEGLLRDKTRPSRIVRLGPDVAERVVALTLADPPAETTQWTADMMATSDSYVLLADSGASCAQRGETWHAIA